MKKYGIFSNYAYFLSRWWKADRKLFALTGADIGLNVLAAAGITLLSAWVVSLLERHLALENVLLTIGMAVVGYVLIQSAWEFYNVMASFRIRKAIVQHFSMGLVQKSLELSYERLEENGIQEERKMAQLAVLDGLEEFWYSTSEILVNALKLLVFGGVVASLNPVLILILTGICLIQLTGYKIAADYEQKTKEKLKGLNVTKEYIQNKAFDVSAAKDIRLYQMQDWLKAVFRRTNRQYTRIRSRIGVGYFLYNIVEQLLQLIREAVIYGYLIYQISQGLNASLAVLYLRSATEFTDRFYRLSICLPEIIRIQNWLADYRKYMEEENRRPENEGEPVPERKGYGRQEEADGALEIEFRDVSFSYPGSRETVLSHLSFVIRAGEKLALVGLNGAGKTTIVKLICGFYSGYEGSIRINGRDLRSLDLEAYREKLAAVFQKTRLLSASVSENILCREDDGTEEEECERLLKSVELWDRVRTFPEGIHTILEKDVKEGGVLLSGGEEQKLLLARLLHKRAGLCLLDEPTAALDALAENRVYEQYRKLTEGRTVLFISHRLASTQFCDRILFLEDGRVREEGTHEELLALGGGYSRLFEVQRKYYAAQERQEGGSPDEFL